MSAAAGLMQGAHAIVAMTRHEPHWMLNDADAKQYGAALANALRHLPVRVAQKYVDYSTFFMVAFLIETPRITRSVQLSRQPAAPNRGPAQVFQFVQPTANAPSPASPPPSAAQPSQPAASQGTNLPPVMDEPEFNEGLGPA